MPKIILDINNNKDIICNENKCPEVFPEELWKKIEFVKENESQGKLGKTMDAIMKKNNYLVNQCNYLLGSLQSEEIDDNICRNKFKNNWTREPSTKLNIHFIKEAQEYINNLINIKKYEIDINKEITNVHQNILKFLLPKEQMINDIPEKMELEKDKIHPEIIKLYKLEEDYFNNKNQIFEELINDESFLKDYIEVYEKSKTEEDIFEKQKLIYNEKIQKLIPFIEEIKNVKNEILNLYSEYKKTDNFKYFQNIEENVNKYMDLYNRIGRGGKYYIDLSKKVSKLVKNGNNWMINRSEEKYKLLRKILGQANNSTTNSAISLNLNFTSTDQKINCTIKCKLNDKFCVVEDLLYEKYPEYKDSENFFLVNGNRINKFKTLEENGLKNDDNIILNTFDE